MTANVFKMTLFTSFEKKSFKIVRGLSCMTMGNFTNLYYHPPSKRKKLSVTATRSRKLINTYTTPCTEKMFSLLNYLGKTDRHNFDTVASHVPDFL